MIGMTAFSWIIEAFNERTGLLGIGIILFILAAVAAGFLVLLLGRPKTEPLQTLAWHPAEIAAPVSAYQIPKLRNEPNHCGAGCG